MTGDLSVVPFPSHIGPARRAARRDNSKPDIDQITKLKRRSAPPQGTNVFGHGTKQARRLPARAGSELLFVGVEAGQLGG